MQILQQIYGQTYGQLCVGGQPIENKGGGEQKGRLTAIVYEPGSSDFPSFSWVAPDLDDGCGEMYRPWPPKLLARASRSFGLISLRLGERDVPKKAAQVAATAQFAHECGAGGLQQGEF